MRTHQADGLTASHPALRPVQVGKDSSRRPLSRGKAVFVCTGGLLRLCPRESCALSKPSELRQGQRVTHCWATALWRLGPKGMGSPRVCSRQITPHRPGATVLLAGGVGGQTGVLARGFAPKETALPQSSPLRAGLYFQCGQLLGGHDLLPPFWGWPWKCMISRLPRGCDDSTVFSTVCCSLTQFLDATTGTYCQVHS